MGFAVFGPGILIAKRLDVANSGAINVGYANEFSFDLAGTTKQLYGQNQYALVAARGTIKSTGKFKAAVLSGIALNACFYGSTMSAGGDQWVIDEAGVVPTTPFQITVTGSATFLTDLGVRYTNTGLPFVRVAAGPTIGQYSVNEATGVYTFAAADVAALVLITYQKQLTVTGQNLILMNQPIGTTPTFALYYYTNLNQPTSKPYVTTIYNCVSSKLVHAFKLEDYDMPEIDFDIFADPSGKVMKVTYPEVS